MNEPGHCSCSSGERKAQAVSNLSYNRTRALGIWAKII